jgi:hypothetical protein
MNNEKFTDNKLNFHSWWGDIHINSINIFKKIFENQIDNYDSIEIYSVFGDPPRYKDPKKLYVHYSGESFYNNISNFDIVLGPSHDFDYNNIIIFPYAYFHILHGGMDINKLLNKRHLNESLMNKEFCLFVVSNPSCEQRNNFFSILSKYKKIDSCGKVFYNCPDNFNNKNYFEAISNYKFMICFENYSKPNYFTEKLINAYYNNTIPIYWGCPNIEDYVNINSILYLKPDFNDNDVNNLINEIILLDNNNELYKKKYENIFFKNSIIPDEFNIDKIKLKINNLVELNK